MKLVIVNDKIKNSRTILALKSTTNTAYEIMLHNVL